MLVVSLLLALLWAAPSSPQPATRPAKPTADNTGPTGPLNTVEGDVEITRDGTVLRDLDVRGTIHVKASNVQLLNFRAHSVKFFHAAKYGGHRNLLVEDGEITSPEQSSGIVGGHMTVRRTEVHHMGADAFNVQADTLLEGNYVHHLGMSDGAHADGVSGTSSDGKPVLGVVIRGNHFDMGSHASRGTQDARPQHRGFRSNGVIFVGLFGTSDRPMIVEDNWLNGGNYTVNSGLPGAHIVYRNNRFGREFNWGLLRIHTDQTFLPENWSGNVWADTGEPAEAEIPAPRD